MGPMVAFYKRLFARPRPQADPFTVAGAQRIVDPLRNWNAQAFYAGLRQQDKLALYHSIYYSQPLATQAVNVLVKMTNSRVIPKSGNPQVDQRMREIWAEINGSTVNAQLIRQSLIYGYGVAEWVSESMTRIDRVVVPDSPLVRFIPNRWGVTEYVQQLCGTVFAPLDPRGRVDARKFVILRRDPISQFDYYGSSLFESAVDQFEGLCRILQAQISVMMRNGRPRFLVTIPAEGLTQEQLKERIEQVKSLMSDLAQDNATDLFGPVGVEVKIIGAEGFGARFTEETRLVLQNLCAAVGLPPALLHIVTQASGGAESFVRQVIVSLQSILDNIQESNAAAWNNSFWPIVQAIEGLPVLPRMEFEAPRLLEMLQEEQARQAKYQNDLAEVVAGIRDPEWLAQQCGANEVYDMDALTEYIQQQRSRPEEVNKGLGSEETNKNGQTKYTDAKASSNTNG